MSPSFGVSLRKAALLVLADGTVFSGEAIGAMTLFLIVLWRPSWNMSSRATCGL